MFISTRVTPAPAWPKFPLCPHHLPAHTSGTALAKVFGSAFSAELHKWGRLVYRLLSSRSQKRETKPKTPTWFILMAFELTFLCFSL